MGGVDNAYIACSVSYIKEKIKKARNTVNKFYNSQQDSQGKGLSLPSNIFDGKTIDQTSSAFLNLLGLAPPNSYIKVHTANGYGSTNTMIRRFTTAQISQGADITYADSATLGASFTINTAGVYAISYTDHFNAASDMGITLNSTQLATNITNVAIADRLAHNTTAAAEYAGCIGATLPLKPGDVIRAHTSGAASGTLGRCIFIIAKVS